MADETFTLEQHVRLTQTLEGEKEDYVTGKVW